MLFLVILLVINHFAYAEDEIRWEAKFETETYSMTMGDSKNISLSLNQLNKENLLKLNATIQVVSDSRILRVSKIYPLYELDGDKWFGTFTVDAIFIGNANISVVIVPENKQLDYDKSSQQISINILRKSILSGNFQDHFNMFVCIFFFVMNINFGMIFELDKVKATIRKPIKPIVAFLCNFIFTPLVRCKFILKFGYFDI